MMIMEGNNLMNSVLITGKLGGESMKEHIILTKNEFLKYQHIRDYK